MSTLNSSIFTKMRWSTCLPTTSDDDLKSIIHFVNRVVWRHFWIQNDEMALFLIRSPKNIQLFPTLTLWLNSCSFFKPLILSFGMAFSLGCSPLLGTLFSFTSFSFVNPLILIRSAKLSVGTDFSLGCSFLPESQSFDWGCWWAVWNRLRASAGTAK